MTVSYTHPVVFAFANDLQCPIPINCTVGGETWMVVRRRLANLLKSTSMEELSWRFYRPGRQIDRAQPFSPTKVDYQIDIAGTIHRSDLESADLRLDIVIVISNSLGLVNYIPRLTMKKTVSLDFPAGLPYIPPKPGSLVKSPEVPWDYQAIDGLIKQLRNKVGEHYHWFSNGYIDKSTIPLYLFMSPGRNGKSRNSSELHNTVLKCFDGTYGDRNHELARILESPLVFHVSLENGQSPHFKEHEPVEIIGYRMLHQLLRNEKSLEELITEWSPPTPNEILKAVERWDTTNHFGRSPRSVFLVVDGLMVIDALYGETALAKLLMDLGSLGHCENSFRIICATSTSFGPIDKALNVSRRKRKEERCSPLFSDQHS